MDDYLSKPVQLAQLRAMLDRWQPELVSERAALALEPDSAAEVAAFEIEPEAPYVPGDLPLDLRVLQALVGNDADTVNHFVDDFHSSSTQIEAELRSAYASGQIGLVAAEAHKLKSSARAVGALQLGELCDAMERAGKANNALALAALMPVFDQETRRVSRFIESRDLAYAN
jgi:HPt (histidine-containing phosphotransfer) domain-containing protein